VMASRKRGIEALTFVPEMFQTEVDSRVQMVDTEHVRGVAWSPKYHAWRAYLHVGRKQVHHSLHETKEAAIAARRAAELRYWGFAMPERLKLDKPGMFKRFNRAPKRTDRYGAVAGVMMVGWSINKIVKDTSGKWAEYPDRRSPLPRSDEEQLGRAIGRLLAFTEYLIMTGDLRVDDIQAGMATQARQIGGESEVVEL
jgi:hypothetical protein